MGAFAQCRKRDLAEPSGKMTPMISWLFPVNFFLHTEFAFLLPWCTFLCLSVVFSLSPPSLWLSMEFVSRSLFWGKHEPDCISASIEVLFLQWVGRSRSAVKLSQDKTLPTALTLTKSLFATSCLSHQPAHPRHSPQLGQKKGRIDWCTLKKKFHTEKKYLGFHTLGVSMLV